MKQNIRTKQVSILIAVCMLFFTVLTAIVPVQAAVPGLSGGSYIKTYPLSTGNNTPVYTSTSLNQRGTSSPYRAYNATIYASDEIYVYSMTDSYSYISYPTSSGRRYGYIQTSAITSNNYSVNAQTSRARITTYRRAGSYTYGYIDSGDSVYTVASSGNWKQVVYPVGSQWKMGWITSDNYNSYIGSNDNTNNTDNNSNAYTGNTASAGSSMNLPGLNGSNYIRSFPLSTRNDTYVYTSSSLGTRGTSYPYREYDAMIYASDEIYIYSMDSSCAYVSYPTSSGRRYGYIRTSAVTANNHSEGAKTSRARITTLRRAGSSYYGYIDSGDTVYMIAQSGNYVQVIYNCGNVYKMGWISQDQYNSYIGGSGQTQVQTNTDSGSVSSQREQVVSYMRQMATVQWSPSSSFKHWSYNRSDGNNFTWTVGTVYYGIPYSQLSRETSLETFKNNLNGGRYVGPAAYNTYLGSDCSSAVSMAWQRVCPAYPVRSTHGMYPVHSYMRKVGNYADEGRTNAATICRRNGSGMMYESYRNLQKGDAVLNNGHVMLVSGVSNSSVTVIEQTTYSSSLHSTWRVDQTYTFSYLYSNGYIPVTLNVW